MTQTDLEKERGEETGQPGRLCVYVKLRIKRREKHLYVTDIGCGMRRIGDMNVRIFQGDAGQDRSVRDKEIELETVLRDGRRRL